MKIISEKDMIERIKKTFPNQNFKILSYSAVTKPMRIKCLSCGKERIVKPNAFLKNKNLCECHSLSNQFKHEENKKKIHELLDKEQNKQFIKYGYKENLKKHTFVIKCLKCGKTFQRVFQDCFKTLKCPYCESGNYLDEEMLKERLEKNYSLLSEFKTVEDKVLLKHNSCGFIWKIRPHNIKSLNGGCPKCNKKRSRGERKIEEYLKNKNINFEIEKNFSWQSNLRYRYDFYIRDFSLVIEYMGQQHFIETSFCEDSLAERQKRDLIKKQESISNGLNYLDISYKDFNNIEIILDKWFNDYSERK